MTDRDPGARIAALLAGSWRAALPPLETVGLEGIAPLLLATGAGPLAWHRIRESALAAGPEAGALHASYRLSVVQAQLRVEAAAQAVAALGRRGVPFLLIKGWAAARLYPELALRPYGDIDLLTRDCRQSPEETADYPVEIHAAGDGAYSVLDPADWPAAYNRAELVRIAGTEVCLPAAEDHLRILISHFFTHGGWRPLWLCDVAAALETRPAGWDWDYFLRGSAERAEWLAVGISLARELLQADPGELPGTLKPAVCPQWVREAVLAQWSEGPGGSRLEALTPEYLRHLGTPARIWEELRRHWPNPVQAAYGFGVRPGSKAPSTAQLAAALRRIPAVVQRR